MKTFLGVASVIVIAVIGLVGFAWLQLRPLPVAVAAERTDALTLANVTLIEPGVGRKDHMTLVIEQDRIAAVRAATATERLQPSKYVVPGLIDTHVHQPLTLGGLPDYFALLYLRHGVTTVRYTGHTDTGDYVEQHGQRIRNGELPGPRVLSCGPILDGDPPFWPASRVVPSPDEARATISDLAATGVDCIKVYTNLQPPVLAAIVQAAGERKLPVLGHVPTRVALEASGIQDIQHLTGVPEAETDTEATNPMLHGWPMLTDRRIVEIADYSAKAGVTHTPTLVFLWTNAMRDRHAELIEATPAQLLPRFFRDAAWLPQESIRLGGTRSAETQDALRAAYRRALDVVRVFHESGVAIQTGTDTANPFIIPGAAVLQEIALLKEAGLDNESALAAATTVPARLTGLAPDGPLQPGAPADLLVLSQDPVADLAALTNVETVVVDGRAYSSEFLQSEIERYQRHHNNFTWDTLLPWLVSLVR